MKKHIVFILITSFIYMWIYQVVPANVINIHNHNSITSIERVLNTKHNIPETIAIGAVGIGETVTAMTLSEVLIALTVTGLVAAMVVPSLINNIQQQQYNAGVWNAYNMLSNAVQTLNSSGYVYNYGTFGSDFESVLNCTQKVWWVGSATQRKSYS